MAHIFARESMMRAHSFAAAVVCAALLSSDIQPAQAQQGAPRTVTAVVVPGKHLLPAPSCFAGGGQRLHFFVTHVQASPFILHPPQPVLSQFATARWVVTVFLRRSADAQQVAQLNAVGTGVVDVEAAVPSGQALLPAAEGLLFAIDVLEIGPTPVSSPDPFSAMEFNVHISGFCGAPR